MGSTASRTVYCISFDGIPMSGIVEECAKLCYLFHKRGYRVLLDLGYDIKPRTAYFGQPYAHQHLLPPWMDLTRLPVLERIEGYTRSFLLDVIEDVCRCKEENGHAILSPQVHRMTAELRELLLAAWRSHDVAFVVIENGTIPENIIYTQALYQAIEIYGRERDLSRFVLWRDHDVMWYYIPGRYGSPPYPAVPKPRRSPYVQHVVTNERSREKLAEWAPEIDVDVLPFYHTFLDEAAPRDSAGLRPHYGIPADAILIARCSRIIPYKRIDRDIHILSEMKRRMQALGLRRDLCLFITGPVDENPEEHRRLVSMARDLGVLGCLRFGDGLLSYEDFLHGAQGEPGARYSVRDLLAQADLSSFLTCYSFEGYGLPPGQAIASKVPYITTTYELYDTIYGSKGFKTLALPITREQDGLASHEYVESLLALLLNDELRREHTEHNYRLGKRLSSMQHFESRLAALLPGWTA